jgi:hypothetical protein
MFHVTLAVVMMDCTSLLASSFAISLELVSSLLASLLIQLIAFAFAVCCSETRAYSCLSRESWSVLCTSFCLLARCDV